MKIQIKARFTDAVLFECEIASETPEHYRLREALQAAVKARANLAGAYLADADLAGANLARANLARADLARADLAGANLADAYLAGANLARANLARADLAGANLADAYLAGANLARANLARANLAGADLAGADLADAIYDILPATPEESIAALDKVREIILDNRERLNMGLWHGDDNWVKRSCAEEATCGTTHCLAGWLQVCSTNEKIRALPNVELAGTLAAPAARRMFFESNSRALEWMENREYAE